MSTSKHIDLICVVVLVLSLALTVLFMNGEALGIQKIVDEDAEQNSGSVYFTANDLNGEWDTSGATVITLNGDGAKISGSGAYAYDGGVVISNAGRYVLLGALSDGSVTVDAYSSSKVWLLLDGVDITCSDDACLRVDQADKVFLTLAAGSENRLTSGAEYSETALADGTNGAIFARDDLTINGSGSLTVTAAYRHGIAANDDLVITGGTITVDAAGDGISVNDSLRIMDAAITVTAGDDGITVTHEDGYLYVESGFFDVTSADDGIHTAGDVTVAGGTFAIDAGDDGIHSDTAFAISDGVILISECYEGIEAPHITIAGGDVTIYPSDDGLNANGGSGSFGGMMMGGFPGQQSEDASDTGGDAETGTDDEEEESWIRISGGALTIVNANARDADGIDSNGSIYISGGSIRVSMANNGGYALDVGSESGGVMEISGGDLVGCGSYAMAESFDRSSTQPSILYTYSAGAEAGTTVALEDTDGNVILSYTAPCAFSCVNLSCPEMELGGTYLIIIGDNVEEITLEEVSASYGDAQSGGFGGPMNFGGMTSREDFGGGHTGGGHGGRSGWPGGSDGTSEEAGERPTPPDFDGEMPDFSQMSEPPELPDGEAPDFGFFVGGMPDFGGGSEAAETEETAEETNTGFAPDTQTWLLLGASLAVLLLGLIVGKAFRKY